MTQTIKTLYEALESTIIQLSLQVPRITRILTSEFSTIITEEIENIPIVSDILNFLLNTVGFGSMSIMEITLSLGIPVMIIISIIRAFK